MNNGVKRETTFQGGLTVGYVRIAHPSNSFTLDVAEQKCSAMANENKLKIDVMIIDNGYNGVNMDRKGMKWIYDNIDIIDNIITSSLSRITRKSEHMSSFIEILSKTNIKLYSCEGVFSDLEFKSLINEE